MVNPPVESATFTNQNTTQDVDMGLIHALIDEMPPTPNVYVTLPEIWRTMMTIGSILRFADGDAMLLNMVPVEIVSTPEMAKALAMELARNGKRVVMILE